MWYVYTMEYYSAIKNEIMLLAGKWIELEDIMLNKVSQVQKDTCFLSCVEDGSKRQTYIQTHGMYMYVCIYL
jgi:hypothetical protein